MNQLSLFPKVCLPKLDEERINYSVTEDGKIFCTVSLSEQDYEQAYQVGYEEHMRMLTGRTLVEASKAT